MKKLNKIYIGALSTIMLLSACNKDLDLKPYQSIQQSQALLTAQDVQITLIGAYNRAGLSALYGGEIFLYSDLMATQTYINWSGTFQDLTQMVNQNMTIDNGFANSTWLDSYEVINQANNVLANLSRVSASNSNKTEGEAKFLRGLMYFDLARIYGKAYNDGTPASNPAVPIVLTPTTTITPASYLTRSSVAAVYQQAINDLTAAETKLPATNSFYANKYSASAILARLYLQKGDFANAAAEATKVISSGNFELNANYADEFPYPGQVHIDNTPEDIFAIQVTPQQGTNALNTFYASADNSGRGDIEIRDNFLNIFEAGDTRIGMYNPDSDGTLRCDKFDNVYGNIHIIRLAELYLIRAEANLRLGGVPNGDTPVNDINVLRARAGVAPMAVVTVNDVLSERVKELAFEGGFFLQDAKRTNNLPSATFAGALGSFSQKLVFPIPQQDLNANPKLVQNPGY